MDDHDSGAGSDGDAGAALRILHDQGRKRKQLERARLGCVKNAAKLKVKKLMQPRIDHHNRKAIRATELISLSAKKREKYTRASRKKWLPSAVVGACFSVRRQQLEGSSSKAAARMRRHRGSKNTRMAPARNPMMKTTTDVAERAEASTSYVQEVRDAVAGKILGD